MKQKLSHSSFHSLRVLCSQRMRELMIREHVLRIFKTLKFFGFAIFTIKNGKSVTTLTDLLFLGANLFVSISLLVCSVIFRDLFSQNGSEILNFGNLVTFVTANCLTTISMMIGFLFRHRIWKIMVELTEIDRMLNSIEFFEDYTAIGRILVTCFLFLMSLSVPLNIFYYYANGSAIKACLFFYSSFYYMLSSALVFVFMSSTLVRIRTVNKICNSISHCSSNVRLVTSGQVEHDDQKLISVMIDIYGKLTEIQHDINICFGGQLMMGLGLLLFYSIFTCFMAYKDLSDDRHLNVRTVATILFSVYLHIFSFAIIQLCCLKEKEAEKTLKLSNEILNRSKDKTKIALLMMLNTLVERNPPKFSCGLFEFDWKLVYGVSFILPLFDLHHQIINYNL